VFGSSGCVEFVNWQGGIAFNTVIYSKIKRLHVPGCCDNCNEVTHSNFKDLRFSQSSAMWRLSVVGRKVSDVLKDHVTLIFMVKAVQENCLILKKKALKAIATSETACPLTPCHIPCAFQFQEMFTKWKCTCSGLLVASIES